MKWGSSSCIVSSISISCCSSSSYYNNYSYSSSSSSSCIISSSSSSSSSSRRRKCQFLLGSSSRRRSSLLLLPQAALPVVHLNTNPSLSSPDDVVVNSSSSSSSPKIDKSGRFCSPRAARELALFMAYASCLEGSDPVRLFDKRVNSPREPGYEFDKNSLMEYNHMTFGGPPVTVDTVKEADMLALKDDKESAIEAEVLSAPPKLVYSKLILRFTRKLLVALVDKWDDHVIVIDKIAPSTWKDEPAGRILELCILHLAMSEITQLGTRHQIVINEAVDLAKRFCDGAAPRIINGCLRTFAKNIEGTGLAQSLEAAKQAV